MDAFNIVSIGGGDGQSQVAKALVIAQSEIAPLRATMITTAVDDGFSTGRLRLKEGDAGYYGDVTRVLDALSVAIFGSSLNWMPKRFGIRLNAGIGEGESFGNLLGDLFSGSFGLAMRGAGRAQCLEIIYDILGLGRIKDMVAQELLMEALEYPLAKDDFPYHSFRNLLLFTLERVAKRRGLPLKKALETLHILYGIPETFRVTPVTWESGTLKASTKLGKLIEGQFRIDFRDRDPLFERFDEVKRLWIDPSVTASDEAIKAVLDADAVIISCGSIMGNVVAPFLVKGMQEALQERLQRAENEKSPFPLIYVMNLMTRMGETQFDVAYTANDIVDLVHKAIGSRPSPVIYDTTEIPKTVLRRLLPEEKIKLGGLRSYETRARYERPSLLKREVAMVVMDEDPGHPPKVIHDPKKLAHVFVEVFSEVLAGALS